MAAVGEVPVQAHDVPVAQVTLQLPLPLHLHRQEPGSPRGTLGIRGPPSAHPTGMGTHPETRGGARAGLWGSAGTPRVLSPPSLGCVPP